MRSDITERVCALVEAHSTIDKSVCMVSYVFRSFWAIINDDSEVTDVQKLGLSMLCDDILQMLTDGKDTMHNAMFPPQKEAEPEAAATE